MVLLGALAFVVALLLSVVLHEAGHFVTARRFGMKATQFFVGFGPTLWSRRKGEVEYGIKAIPAGGFVKIVGMTPLEEVDPADEPRAFYRQPAPRRAVVLAAGSFMHFVIAIVLVWLAVWIGGQPDPSRVQVESVSVCVAGATDTSCEGRPPSPARQIGLLPGDEVLAVDGVAVTSQQQFRDLLRDHGATPVTIDYRRDGERRTGTAAPEPVTIEGQQIWRIGVGTQSVIVRDGPIGAAADTPGVLGEMVSGTFDALLHFPEKLETIFAEERDPNGAVGVVGVSRLSGDILALPGETWSTRIGTFIGIVAGVNLFVGVFNLLPLMPLDGGHLGVLGFEQARDKVRRRRGYTGPLQRVDLNKLLPATYAVVLIFATLTIVLALADIVNPIRLR